MSDRLQPYVNIQWKGTDVCLDFQCECSDKDAAYEYHFDGFMFGSVQCPRCGTVWDIAHNPTVTRSDSESAALLEQSDG